ncbi:MAG: penicillin-binding transpeptidase domain-containing protein, partial [Chloroflexota bacterium]
MSIWRRNEELEDTSADVAFRGRLFFLQLIILISLSMLLFRVFWLQQVRGDDLRAQSTDNRTARLLIDAPRGVIFDRDGNLLATNEPSFNVTITPAFLPTDEAERLAVFQRLSLLTGVPVTNTTQQQELVDAADPALVRQYTELARLYGAPIDETLDASGLIPQLPDSIQDVFDTFSFAQYLPATVRAGVTITEAYLIEQESLYLPGVRIIPEPVRRYPTGPLTAHLIGFMGPLPNEGWLDLGYERDDRVGLAGLEVSLEPLLAGQKGERQIVTDWTGREVQQLGVTAPPVAGYNAHLTINTELQRISEEILLDYMDQRRNFGDKDFFTGQELFREIELGVVVAIDPRDGQVLAMVNIPTWDNNRFSTEIPVDYYLQLIRNEYEPFLNHAIAGQYPPGSVFKVVTVAAALQEGIVSPNRR